MKELPDPGFAGDEGRADPALAAALVAMAADPAAEADVLCALADARVLVPVVAVLAEEDEPGAGGLRTEKRVDMAVTVLEGEDGRRALPVFSSLETLARWRPDARPVPVRAPDAALAALDERAEVIVLDVGGPLTVVVEGATVAALAGGAGLPVVVDDPAVLIAVRAATYDEDAVVGVRLARAAGVDARLDVVLVPGLDAAQVTALGRRLSAALGADPVLRATLTRGLDVAFVRA